MKCFLSFIFLVVYTTHYRISANSENENLRSLVFVFDTTVSMSEELEQVRIGATKIFKTLSENKKKIIENYIFVEFNDPKIGPWIDTKNSTKFEHSINGIKLHSTSSDCPEMSLGGIKKGLELCLENSFVYVFTDAAPKDTNLLPEVLELIQRKKSQVIFVLTEGNCGDDNIYRPYPEYKTIVESSGGQIFDLSQEYDVSAVLEFVRLSLPSESDKVSLLSIDSHDNQELHNYNSTYSVPVDEGQQIEDSSKLRNLLDLEKIKVVSIQSPTPGVWKINVGESKHCTLRVTGESDFNFNYGFALGRINSMNDTNQRPLIGSKNNIFLTPNNGDYVPSLELCEIVAINGTVMQTVSLRKVKSIDNLYHGAFVPVKFNFYVRATGKTKKGMSFQRISRIAISPSETTEKQIIPGEIISSACNFESSMIFNGAVVVSYVYWFSCTVHWN